MNSIKKAKEIILEWQQRTQWNSRLQPSAPRFDIAKQVNNPDVLLSKGKTHIQIAIDGRGNTHKSSKIDNDNRANLKEPDITSQHVLICIGLSHDSTAEDRTMADLQRTVEEQAETRANHHCKKNKKERACTGR